MQRKSRVKLLFNLPLKIVSGGSDGTFLHSDVYFSSKFISKWNQTENLVTLGLPCVSAAGTVANTNNEIIQLCQLKLILAHCATRRCRQLLSIVLAVEFSFQQNTEPVVSLIPAVRWLDIITPVGVEEVAWSARCR